MESKTEIDAEMWVSVTIEKPQATHAAHHPDQDGLSTDAEKFFRTRIAAPVRSAWNHREREPIAGNLAIAYNVSHTTVL